MTVAGADMDELWEQIATLREQIRELSAMMREIREMMHRVSNDHEHRLRALERRSWAYPATVVAAVIAAVASLVQTMR